MNNLPVGTIVFDGVSKRYRLGALGSLRNTLAALARPDKESNSARELWALRDVSFRVEPGVSFGLIGPNGAGKTTALKLLSNITRPTTGSIHVNGRMSSLIELGAGFHPELSGRDNIFLNGAILGLSRREVQRKLDDIIAFSELERFIDTPVKRYSSGMYVRLGFAVAAHVEPDVLVVDEVLAVGDASFRSRCVQQMQSLQRNGTTIVFVSHNMHLVSSMCDRGLLLTQGQVRLEGDVSEVVKEYESTLRHSDLSGYSERHEDRDTRQVASSLMLNDFCVTPADEQADGKLTCDQPAIMRVRYVTGNTLPIGRVVFFIVREVDNILCFSTESNKSRESALELRELSGEGVIEVLIDPLQLAPGQYYAVAKVTDVSDSVVVASTAYLRFDVHAGANGVSDGVYVPQLTWQHQHSRLDTDTKKG